MAVVEFVAEDWLEVYPQFKGLLSEAQLNYAFQIACMIIDNTDESPIPYDPENGVEIRKILLWLLVCHLAALALRPINQSGPTTSATEGSVSVSFQIPTIVNGSYFAQTPCGETFWQLMRRFMSGGRYYDMKKFHPWG